MSSSSAPVPQHGTLEGWGVKEGGSFKTWKKRWFVFDDTRMAYYTDRERRAEKGAISRDYVVSVHEHADHEGHSNMIALVTAGEKQREYLVSLENAQERARWIAFIRRWIQTAEAAKAGVVFVTGATGKIGSHVVTSLLDIGCKVRVGVRDPAKATEFASKGAEVVQFTFENVGDAFKGASRVFLLPPLMPNFVELMAASIAAAEAAGVQHVVKISALTAGTPDSPRICAMHGESDKALRESRIPSWTIVRPSSFMENFLMSAPAVAQTGKLFSCAGLGAAAYIAVEDVAACAVVCLLNSTAHKHKSYDLTGSEALKWFNVADILSDVLGHRIAYVDLTADKYLGALMGAGVPEWMSHIIVDLEESKKAGKLAAVTDTVQQLLQRPPQLLRDFLRAHAKLFVAPLYFVVGSTGTVGTHVAQALLRAGCKVRVGLRDVTKGEHLRSLGAEVVHFDLSDVGTINRALRGVARVFLLVPIIPDATPLGERFINACKEAGVEVLVKMSGMGANRRSVTPTVKSHGELDEAVTRSGIPQWVIVRPNFFMSNYVNFRAHDIRTTHSYSGCSGDGATSYVDPRDVADVVAAVLLTPQKYNGQTLDVTGPEALTEQQIAELLSSIVGTTITYTDMDPEEFEVLMMNKGAPKFTAALMVGLDNIRHAGLTAAVTNTVNEVVGRAPRNLRDYFAEHEAAFQDLRQVRFLVLGASGHIGGRVAEKLLKAGATVRVAVRHPAKVAALQQAGAEVVQCDYSDSMSLRRAFEHVHRAFILVPWSEHMHVDGEKIITAAAAAGVLCAVRLSGAGADASSSMNLAKQHGLLDNVFRNAGFAQWAIVQPGFLMDSWLVSDAATIKKEGRVFDTAGDGRVAYISVDDVAEACVAVLSAPHRFHGQSLVLTGSQAITRAEGTAEISSQLGRPLTYVNTEKDRRRTMLAEGGLPEWMIRDVLDLSDAAAAGAGATVSDTFASIVGHAPQTFQTFVRQHVTQFRAAP